MSLQIYYGIPFDGTQQMINQLLNNENFKEVIVNDKTLIEVKNDEEKDLLEKGNIILFTDKGPKIVLNECAKFTSC